MLFSKNNTWQIGKTHSPDHLILKPGGSAIDFRKGGVFTK